MQSNQPLEVKTTKKFKSDSLGANVLTVQIILFYYWYFEFFITIALKVTNQTNTILIVKKVKFDCEEVTTLKEN